MHGQSENDRQVIIKKICEHVIERVPEEQAELLTQFAARYYASAPLEDLFSHSIEDLAGALLSHWSFIYQREPGEAKLKVFNPSLEENGWQSNHTIIELSHDDIPFLVDTIRMVVNRNDIQIHLALHIGGLKVIRDANHKITKILSIGDADAQASTEAPLYFEIDRQTDDVLIEKIKTEIEHGLTDVRACVADWRKMVLRAEEALVELEENPPALDLAEITESKDFLRWLIDNHFTFLGARDYKLIGDGSNRALQTISGSGLGVLRDESVAKISKIYADLPPQARKLALSKNILIIAKTNTKSTVHRDAYTDYIGVKRFNKNGELIGERRFIGLYTSTAYSSSARHIPFLRHKVAKALLELRFPPDSHNGKEALHILETLPRDDLFQATHEELRNLTLGILQLQERKRIRLFVRKDAYGRYFSCFVYLPREIFTTELSNSMEEVLVKAFQGKASSFSTFFSDSVLARIHFQIRINPKNQIDYDLNKIEQELIATARSWGEEFKTLLLNAFGEAIGLKYFSKYRKAFPASYTECYTPATAIEDIKKIENLSADHPLGMIFYRSGTELRLKLFHISQTIALSDVLPTLENMGLRILGERPHEIRFKEGTVFWINDFNMIYHRDTNLDVDSISDIFQDAFANIWFENAEDDGFNRLVLGAQLTWHETAVLRAYTKYLRQTGFTFSQNYIELALINHPTIAKDLITLFLLCFSPEHRSDPSTLISKIEKSFDDVASLDEDRILRRLLEVMRATLRTNYFQRTPEGNLKPHISFKFDPSKISDLPLPRPMYEIFVYSPRVEGVHLRAGKVARGGIRWSDRREDFRTEVLGLMKAQNVKNSVIVPVGAKGGFFPKQLAADGDRDAIMTEVIYCYSTFIRGLLDITDNIRDKEIIPPVDVVCYDDYDPYLVVAADKGTATFSDLANAIAKSYNFWLGDAFASGGSAGYDHKKMGITARGAWESAKRHFSELNINPELNDFTVVGIGDMSGDVFGNGMLMSKHIKLIAAFDHRHIFIDPNPDPKRSYDERQRMFNLPRSSWMDYDSTTISAGGGVFPRSAKSIKLTPELQQVLNIHKDFMVPNELIRELLKSPVDLIFNGGIGTFVKASFETHAEAGDRTNDGIRVDGKDLQAKSVCEGGNLGFTQEGRIEYSLNGGIMYTDFIDNSAGVDCSDHEVNIKILLNKVMEENLLTLPERDILLEAMADEVALLVLRDNYEQTQMLTLEASVATRTADLFIRYMDEMEKKGHLNRRLEFLPEEKVLQERKATGLGLTRPEIAVMIAYCKMFLKQDILASDVPEDVYFVKYLKMAFPKELSHRYLPQMKEHSLRREIISTQLAKLITDHLGVNFVERLQRETGAPVDFVIRAFAIADELFTMTQLWHQIEALDYKVSVAIQHKMMLQIYFLIRRGTRWFLRNRKNDIQILETIDHFRKPISALTEALPHLMTLDEKEELESNTNALINEGVPPTLAHQTSLCEILFTSLDIVESATKNNLPLESVAQTYYKLDFELELNWLRTQMNSYVIENQWDELARSRFRDDLEHAQSQLSVNVLKFSANQVKNASIDERLELWMKHNNPLITRWLNLLSEIRSSIYVDFVTFSIGLRELFDLAQTTQS